jgi:hypothetical protein
MIYIIQRFYHVVLHFYHCIGTVSAQRVHSSCSKVVICMIVWVYS